MLIIELIIMQLIGLIGWTGANEQNIDINKIPCEFVDQYKISRLLGDNGFKLSIDTDQYVPNRTYTVTLSNNDHDEQLLTFKAFRISAHFENGSSAGILTGTVGESEISEQCKGSVVGGTDVFCFHESFSRVSVDWQSPPVRAKEDAGCVVFRAVVILRGSTWFANEGHLSKKVCAKPAGAAADEQTRDRKCCACGSAKYELTFHGLWSQKTHPKDWPPESLLHWGDFVGATHSIDYTMWRLDELASDGMKHMALYGSGSVLEQEIVNKSQTGAIRDLISMKGIWNRAINDRVQSTFTLSPTHNLVSLASMFGPSPDWFSGIDSINLCNSNCTWMHNHTTLLQPFDAGVDDGITYLANKKPTIPQSVIKQITLRNSINPLSPFHKSGDSIPAMANVSIVLKQLRGIQCPNGVEDTNIDSLLHFDDRSERELRKSLMGRTKLSGKAARNKTRYSLKIIDDQMHPECRMNEWSEWSPCSSGCGNGYQYRSRSYDIDLTSAVKKWNCSERLEEKKRCFSKVLCSSLHQNPLDERCNVSDWSEWSVCSEQCGLGDSQRTRKLLNEPFRADCVHIPLVEKKSCVGNGVHCKVALKLDMFEKKRICMQPKDMGSCKAFEDRYYLDFGLRKCTKFRYGGCEGNENNFKSVEDCENVCDILLLGRTSSGVDSRCVTTQWSDWSACSIIGRGTGTQTRFRSYRSKPLALGFCGEELEQVRNCTSESNKQAKKLRNPSDCLKLVEPGPCKQNITRYYYDMSVGKCMMFKFGGCRAEHNNFDSMQSCERTCEVHIKNAQNEKPSTAKCAQHPWSRWSSCFFHKSFNAFVKTRKRSFVAHDAQKYCAHQHTEEWKQCSSSSNNEKSNKESRTFSCCPSGLAKYNTKLKATPINELHGFSEGLSEFEFSDTLIAVHTATLNLLAIQSINQFLMDGDLNYISDHLLLNDSSQDSMVNILMLEEQSGFPVAASHYETQSSIQVTTKYAFVSILSSIIPTGYLYTGALSIDLCDQNRCEWKRQHSVDLLVSEVNSSVSKQDLNANRLVNLKIGEFRFEFAGMEVSERTLTTTDQLMHTKQDIRCETTAWLPWSECKRVFNGGGGMSTTVRQYVNPDQALKMNCTRRLRAKKACFLTQKSNCDLSEWSSWSPCSNLCGFGMSKRFRKLVSENVFDQACNESLVEEKVCESRDHCDLLNQSQNSDVCELEVDDGSPCRSDLRRFYYNPKLEKCVEFAFGGCRGNANNFETSSECEKLCAKSCRYGDWSDWSDCNVTKRCTRKTGSEGTQWRQRVSIKGNCENRVLIQSRKCFLKENCERMDCTVTEWSPWSQCQYSNNLFTKYRTREVIQIAKNGGKDCPALREIRAC